MEWEAVIGLEIHVELNTTAKLFSKAPNRFGDEPNTNITDVCTGQPGALPVLNREAVHKAVKFGCAVGADVAHYSRFDRKSYFYPDSPRNFQITQFDRPIIRGGSITADVHGKPQTFTIGFAHLEDDAGMLKHYSGFAGADYNRAGVPLIEIVSTPCIHSADEAIAYASGIKAVLQYLDVSDCNMEEGSLRMDVNISVRPKGSEELRNKVEIKNLNSFTFMGMAIEAEMKRQIRHYNETNDEPIESMTCRWDVEKKQIVVMRRKETAEDYRYFLEPDLPPILIEQEYIDAVEAALPELPYAREKRYIADLDLPREAAGIIVNEKALADYFEEGLSSCKNAKSLCNWIVVEFAGRFKDTGKTVWTSGIEGAHIGHLVNMIDSGVITGKIAKDVADLMVKTPGKSPQQIVEENPAFKPMADEGELEKIIDQVLADNGQSVEDYKNGKERAFGYLVGQVMKATQGKAPPPLVNRLLKQKITQQ